MIESNSKWAKSDCRQTPYRAAAAVSGEAESQR